MSINNSPLQFLIPKKPLLFMEYPFFTLRVHSLDPIHFRYKNFYMSIIPGKYGLPSISDCDVLIYCTSKLINALNSGGKHSSRVKFNAYSFLKFSNKSTCGKSYRALHKLLLRLQDTNYMIEHRDSENLGETRFRLIDVIEFGGRKRDGVIEKITCIEIKLSDWLFNEINPKRVLTIEKSYFKLNPTEKILYGLIRKHLGTKASWVIRLNTLFCKMNVNTTIYEFRRVIKTIAKNNKLPGFRFLHKKTTDKLYIFSRSKNGTKLMMKFLLEK